MCPTTWYVRISGLLSSAGLRVDCKWMEKEESIDFFIAVGALIYLAREESSNRKSSHNLFISQKIRFNANAS